MLERAACLTLALANRTIDTGNAALPCHVEQDCNSYRASKPYPKTYHGYEQNITRPCRSRYTLLDGKSTKQKECEAKQAVEHSQECADNTWSVLPKRVPAMNADHCIARNVPIAIGAHQQGHSFPQTCLQSFIHNLKLSGFSSGATVTCAAQQNCRGE